MEGQPISAEALERPVEENRPPPNPVEGAGTGPIGLSIFIKIEGGRGFSWATSRGMTHS